MINVNFKLLPQFEVLKDDYRELAIHSGRGAGKSHAVAIYLIMESLLSKKRILCVREIQDSIADSVLKLLADKISDYKLSDYFDVQRTTIYCRATGSEFIFKGVHRHINSIKSMEGINFCWVEEAHTISQESLDILLPTIFRNKAARVIYTYNPRISTDAVYRRFNGEHQPPKSIVKRFDWRDNPYFSDDMKDAMAFDKKHDPEMAMHIWEGELCPSPNDIAVLPQHWLRQSIEAYKKFKPMTGFKYLGLDFAVGGKDKSALAYRQGPVIRDVFDFDVGSISKAVDKAHAYALTHTATHEKIEFIWFDEVGVGAGAIDDFARLKNPGWQYYMPKAHNGAGKPNGYDARFSMAQTNGQFFRNLKAQAWWHLRLRLENTLKLMDGQNIPLAKCLFISDEIERKYGKAHLERLILELGQASYKHEDGKLIVDKQPDNKVSPNQADAVIMSFDSDMHNGLGYLL